MANTGDQIKVGGVTGEGIAIGRNARVEINRFTEIIVRPDSFENVPPAPGKQPYKGLSYFTETDADNFFGREELSDQIVSRLKKIQFLTVIGASGSGKSSLLRAGVVPLLRKQNWLIQIITPTARPLQRLANVLVGQNNALTAAEDLQKQLIGNPRALHLAANRLAGQANSTHMLLIIDQFEELFTLCHDENERKAFIDNLLTAAGEEGSVTILIGLRADFYGQTAQYEGLRTIVSQQQEFIGPMRQENLVRIIAEPAKRGGWQFVTGLVEQILEDAKGEPGLLPLLSHALLETWEQRKGTVLTLGGYRTSGGLKGAIAKTAEATLQRLNKEQSSVVKHIFLSLTELGDGVEDTRRIASPQELKRITADEAVIDDVVEELVRARLITVDEKQVQVAHEALIRRWPRLRSWIDEDRERLSFNHRLSRAVQEWEDNGRQPDYLLHGSRLAQAESRIEEYKSWDLSRRQAEFIQISREVAAQKAREEEKRTEVGRQESRRLTNFAVIGGATGVGVAGILLNLVNPDMAGIIAVFYVAFAFLIGTFVGFFYVPFFDSIVSAIRQRNELLTWPASILAGLLAFELATFLLFFLPFENKLVVLLAGGAWGAMAGAGRLWIQRSKRSRMFTVPLVAVLSGIVFGIVYAVLHQLGFTNQPFTLWLVPLLGILVPQAILLAENWAYFAGSRRNHDEKIITVV